MLNCNDCIKKDVCGKMDLVKQYIDTIKLSYEFQQLENSGVDITFTCKNKLSGDTKILRGEE